LDFIPSYNKEIKKRKEGEHNVLNFEVEGLKFILILTFRKEGGI
jgi:hypothetical protein